MKMQYVRERSFSMTLLGTDFAIEMNTESELIIKLCDLQIQKCELALSLMRAQEVHPTR